MHFLQTLPTSDDTLLPGWLGLTLVLVLIGAAVAYAMYTQFKGRRDEKRDDADPS